MDLNNNCYGYTYNKDEMILRDFLATDRTALANERTVLAYARTAISIVAAGVGFIKLFDSPIIRSIGYAFFPVGLMVLVYGLYRFIKIERKLKKIKY